MTVYNYMFRMISERVELVVEGFEWVLFGGLSWGFAGLGALIAYPAFFALVFYSLSISFAKHV